MLISRPDSIFDSPATAWVNAVNCVGVMGKGLALEFRVRFPEMFTSYRAACARGELAPGALHVFEAASGHHPRYIVNFPTKRHWRDVSRLGDIRTGLNILRAEIAQRKITSIAIPALGCGLGGLSWAPVFRLIETELSNMEGVTVFVYPPCQPAAPTRV